MTDDANRTIAEHLDACDQDACCLDKHRDEIEQLQTSLDYYRPFGDIAAIKRLIKERDDATDGIEKLRDALQECAIYQASLPSHVQKRLREALGGR